MFFFMNQYNKDKIIYYDTVTYEDINKALINTIIVTIIENI